MVDPLNRYEEPVKKSPGEKEVETGSVAVELARALGILKTSSSKADIWAFQRAGELIKRRWRNLTLRKPLA